MFIFQKQHRQSTPVFLKVGGIDPLVAILNGKGEKPKGATGEQNNIEDKNAQLLIDHWVNFYSQILAYDL